MKIHVIKGKREWDTRLHLQSFDDLLQYAHDKMRLELGIPSHRMGQPIERFSFNSKYANNE